VMRSYERLPTRYEAVPRLVPAQCIARLWRRSAGIATRRISAITVASIVDRAAGLVQRRLEVGDCWCTGPDRIEAQALSSLSQFQQWRRLWLFCHDALPRRQSDAHGHGVLRSILKAAVHHAAWRCGGRVATRGARGGMRYTGRSSLPNAFVGVENELTQGNIC